MVDGPEHQAPSRSKLQSKDAGVPGNSRDSGKSAGSGKVRSEQASFVNLFQPGDRVGRYRLLAPIATGGMAQVWAAKPEGAGFARTVALKLIRNELAADEEYLRMFIDEATVASSVRHPNVCETFELGQEDGILFMAIEWVAGDSLAGLLHRDQGLEPLKYRLAARIIADVCSGLHAAHEVTGNDGEPLGVVHRDISPPNILLSLHGQVKVSDFGIAKARYQLHSRTKTGEIKGKFAYIAPEQIMGKMVDRRVDIFALGSVLYVATLGLRPFGSGPKAMAKILSADFKRPTSLVETYPAELEAIIVRALARDPNDRYSTAENMRMDLERWLLSTGVAVGTKDVAELVNSRLDPDKREAVETLMRSNQFLPGAMASQLLREEIEQTPTATSSVMYSPEFASETRAPAPVKAKRTDGSKPMVRFSQFNSPMAPAVPPGRDSAHSVPGDDATLSEPNLRGGQDEGDGPTQLDPRGSDASSLSMQIGQDALPTFRPQANAPPRRAPPVVLSSRDTEITGAPHKKERPYMLWALFAALAVIVWLVAQLIP